MRILISGSRPFADGSDIYQALISQAVASKGEVLEVVRRRTGEAEAIAGYVCQANARLGLLDSPVQGKPQIEGVDMLWVFLTKGTDQSRAYKDIVRCKAAGILVVISISD
jgi:hypothetical protein